METNDLLEKLKFSFEQDCLNVECFNYNNAVELWSRRKDFAAYLSRFPEVRRVKIMVFGRLEYPILKLQNPKMLNQLSKAQFSFCGKTLNLDCSSLEDARVLWESRVTIAAYGRIFHIELISLRFQGREVFPAFGPKDFDEY